jgi:hypothetical protein
MRTTRRLILAVSCAAIVALASGSCGGGGGSSTTQPTQTQGSQSGVKTLTAAINPVPTSQGQPVAAATLFTATNVTGALLASGVVGIAGTNSGISLNINLTGIPGPGTYPITSASWSDGTGVYVLLNGGTGTITFSTATTSRITGTFSFVANDLPSGNPAQKRVNVTNGVFDISNP